MNELFDLTDKVAIVTGGANGIGKACALQLAQFGAKIAIGDLKLDDAQEAVKEIEQAGGKAIALECNILKDEQLVRLVEDTVQQLGGVHILVNNAGGGGGGGKENPFKISVEDFERDFHLNVFSERKISPGPCSTLPALFPNG